MDAAERSLLFLTKFFPLILLLLCQPVSQSMVKTVSGQASSESLVYAEVNALMHFTDALEVISRISNCTKAEESVDKFFVGCKNQHVTEIKMENARLTGVISADVSELENLEKLDLSANRLHGIIPPELGNLSHLRVLDLSGNQLTGPIPQSLGNLKNLTTLYLFWNLLSGMIPPSLGGLSSLEHLDLWCNNLTGPIPPQLGQLAQLIELRLDDNELNGTLPKELGKLGELQFLFLTSNNFIGNIPKEYEGLTSLQMFAVAGNYLSGPTPSFIAHWSQLTLLNLLGNNFEGELPQGIFMMKNLQFLMVSDLNNSAGFKIPDSANLSSLWTLILRNCNIVGEIPSWIGNGSSYLNMLDLSFNNLEGTIPESFENQTLQDMFLTNNMLNGSIPGWITTVITSTGDFSENNFDEPKNLKDAKLNTQPNRTSLHDILERRNCHGNKSKNHSLFINAGGEAEIIAGNRYDEDNSTSNFYVADNWAYSCSGDYIFTVSNSSDFIKNISCGISVPEAPLYQKARLCPQSLTYYGLCFREGNYTVRLYFAEIVFAKDEDQSSLGKRVFDVYIQGERVLEDFNIKAEAGGPNLNLTKDFNASVGDDNLLTIRLYWAGKGSMYNPPRLNGPLISAISVTPNYKVNDGGLSTKQIVGIAAGSVVAAVLALLLLLAFMWRMGWVGDRELRVTTVKIGETPYTVKQIKGATRNFNPSNQIGEGRFGITYKAELAKDQIVAVKKLSFQSKRDQIGTEVYALKRFRHENLVGMLDVYSKRDLHLIIYEYMEKGSLQQALFGGSNFDGIRGWKTRVNICLGIARGLKYLHGDDIVHRNVKPSNILLDGNFSAKISDLGLAKLYDEENPYKFIEEIGTVAYMAPEYTVRQSITPKADVYSYGIVVIEIVSGRSNSKPEKNQDNAFLLDEACVLFSSDQKKEEKEKRLLELVDKQLSTSSDYDPQQALRILELAMACINQAPTLRPTMSQVVCQLEKIYESHKSKFTTL